MTDLRPSNSTIASVGLGIPTATLIAWLLDVTIHVQMPGEVQAAMGALISAIIGYAFLGGRHVDTTDEPSEG